MVFQRIAQAVTVGFTLLAAVPAAADANKSILVLDASGSMWGQIDGEAKITIARRVIGDLLDTFPEDQALGLSAYGHNRKGDCGDIEQLVAPSLGSAPAIRAAVEGINPKGKTPLAAAVISAAKSLRSEEEPATIILISDGIETCGLDPCAMGAELEKAGVDFTTHVIGFDVGLSEDRDQLACLAGSTGGEFLAAANASELSKALETVAEALPIREPEPVEVVPEVVSVPDRLTIVDTKASKDRANPADLRQMEIVSGRVGENVDHFWKVTLEPGAYNIVVDVERADDDHGYTPLDINFTRADGRPAFKSVDANGYYVRERSLRAVQVSARMDLVINLGDTGRNILDYKLAVLPANQNVPTPYLVGSSKLSELTIGQKAVSSIEGVSQETGEVWYAVTLDAKDYEFIAEFTDKTGKQGFISAEATVYGSKGERLPGTKRLCAPTGYEQTISCAARTSLADERRFLIRLNPIFEGSFLTGFKIVELN